MMAKTSFAPGFRFHPTDAELVCYYLKRKVMGKPLPPRTIAEIELYKFAPCDLPDKSCLKSKDLEWYFFCPQDRKYPNGSRKNRTAKSGFWKTTGKDRSVVHDSRTVGMIKTLVFHEGKATRGSRTDWVMHEYRLEDKTLTDAGIPQDAFVLCKVFEKSGRGPKNGEQHGAPFNDEEWEDDTGVDCSASVSCMFSSPAPLNDQITIMLEPGPPAPAAVSGIGEAAVVSGIGEAAAFSGIGEVSLLHDGEDELWNELVEALRSSPDNLGDALGEASSSHVLPCETNFTDAHLRGIYDGLFDLPLQVEPKEVNNCTNTMYNECALLPEECVQEFYSNAEQFLMDIDPSDLVIPDDLLAYDPFENLPSFQSLNDTGVTPPPVDDTPAAAAITDSLQGPISYPNQCTPNVEINNAFGEDGNQQNDVELHQLNYPAWQTDYDANIYSTPGAGGSGYKKTFYYSHPSCYPYR